MDIKFNIMFEKYNFLKTFKSNKDYDDFYPEEISTLLTIHSRINEVQSKCMELNAKR